MPTTETNTADTTTTTTTTTTTPLLNPTDSELREQLSILLERSNQHDRNPERPSIVLELIWSSIIIALAFAVVFVVSKGETPQVPLRVWIVGFAVLRVLRMIWLCVDHLSHEPNVRHLAVPDPKCLHIVIGVLNVIWWIIGIYWMVSGEEKLLDNAPKLYWFTAIFLALDMLLFMLFALVSFLICVAGLCCYPCIMSILSNFAQHSQQDNPENGDLVGRMARSISRRISDTRESSNNGATNERDTDTDTDTKHAVSVENAV